VPRDIWLDTAKKQAQLHPWGGKPEQELLARMKLKEAIVGKSD